MIVFTSFLYRIRPSKVEHHVMLSLLIYTIGSMFYYNINTTLGNALRLYGVIYYLYIFFIHPKYIYTNSIIETILFNILIIWTIGNTFYTFIFNSESWNQGSFFTTLMYVFFTPNIMPYLLALTMLLFPKKYEIDFRYLFYVFGVMAIVYLCLYPFSFWSMIHYTLDTLNYYTDDGEIGQGSYGDFINNSTLHISVIAVPSIMIFLYKYLTIKKWLIYMTCYIGGLLLIIYMARRGAIMLSLITLFMVCVGYWFNNSGLARFKILIIMISLIVGISLFSTYTISNSFFSVLKERGIDDTRFGVEQSFYQDMDSITDLVFGRGWFGAYYDSIVYENRNGIETGYLTIILKGGLLYFIPFVCVIFCSIIRGLFRSKNIFVKSFATYNIIYLISLYPFGWPTFTFSFFMTWIGVYVCCSPYYLNMTDNDVYVKYFKSIE